jgi:hypothetical protein
MSTDDTLIRANQPDQSVKTDDSDAEFKIDKPEQLPQLTIQNLPEDAKSISPEDLAHVPTLTESVTTEDSASVQSGEQLPEQAAQAQELMPQTDSWIEVCQMRIANLSDEIHSLNERLDRFEKRIKA